MTPSFLRNQAQMNGRRNEELVTNGIIRLYPLQAPLAPQQS